MNKQQEGILNDLARRGLISSWATCDDDSVVQLRFATGEILHISGVGRGAGLKPIIKFLWHPDADPKAQRAPEVDNH